MRTMLMRYPGGKAKAVTFSYDDGVIQDRRLAELFDKYGLKGTFNFNNEAGKNLILHGKKYKKFFFPKVMK